MTHLRAVGAMRSSAVQGGPLRSPADRCRQTFLPRTTRSGDGTTPVDREVDGLLTPRPSHTFHYTLRPGAARKAGRLKAGPKAARDMSPLPLRGRATGAKRFDAFCKQHIYVPKGKGALSRLKLRPWQLELVGSVLDAKPPPRMAGWMLPRGQGKTSLVAALGLYDMCLGEEGASVVVVATNEQQAGICFRTAVRMVELEPELESRI